MNIPRIFSFSVNYNNVIGRKGLALTLFVALFYKL